MISDNSLNVVGQTSGQWVNPKKSKDGCCLKLLELKANPLWSIRVNELTILVIFLGEFLRAKY